MRSTLSRINSGEYGYCDLSGEEIGVRRLDAQPAATLCIQVQELLERNSQINAPCSSVECFADAFLTEPRRPFLPLHPYDAASPIIPSFDSVENNPITQKTINKL